MTQSKIVDHGVITLCGLIFCCNLYAAQPELEQPTEQSQHDKSATELVEIIDSYRGLSNAGFSFDITNVSYKAARDSRTNKLSVDVKAANSLVRFQSPARQQGRVLLKQDNDMWLYIPGTRKVIRISPAQRLLGETSNADVTGSNFSRDYNANIVTNEADKQQSQIQTEDGKE